jgi:hypothetical protein
VAARREGATRLVFNCYRRKRSEIVAAQVLIGIP